MIKGVKSREKKTDNVSVQKQVEWTVIKVKDM